MNPLRSKWLLLSLMVIVGWLAFSLPVLHTRWSEFEKALADLNQKIGDAERSRAYLEKFAAYFKTPEFLEKEAREKLNYKLPDESVAFVFRDSNSKLVSEEEENKNIDKAPNYKKWWYYILGY